MQQFELVSVDTARRLAKVGRLLAKQNSFDQQVLESLKRIEFTSNR